MNVNDLKGVEFFKDRFDENYLDRLIDILSDIDTLINEATGPAKSKKYEEGNLSKGIQIDFCGLAATILLGVNIQENSLKEKRSKIKGLFIKLLSIETLKELNEKGIYLKVRFIFPYIYSAFSSNLIYAEKSITRPYTNNPSRKIDYSFTIEKEWTHDFINSSTLKRDQTESLVAISGIAKNNHRLVLTQPEKADNTLQVRFTLMPILSCITIINNIAFTDAYTYSQENVDEMRRNLFYHSPVLMFHKKKETNLGNKETHESKDDYYQNLINHFDYIWNNDLTLLCRDTTYFDTISNNYIGLSLTREPNQLLWEQKRARIIHHLTDPKHKIPYSEEEAEEWKKQVREKAMQYIIVPKGNNNESFKNVVTSSENNQHEEKSSLSFWVSDGQHQFKLSIPAAKIEFIYSKLMPNKLFEPELLYGVLLHYAYAKQVNKEPVLHKKHKDKLRIFKHITSPLHRHILKSSFERTIDTDFVTKFLFDANRHYECRIDIINVSEEVVNSLLNKAYYRGGGASPLAPENIDPNKDIYQLLGY